jgi:hypothetical protein
MRKLSYAAGALVVAVAVALPGIAPAKQAQTVSGSVKPRLLPKKKRRPVALRVITKTSDPAAVGQVPSPAIRSVVNFDDAGNVFPGVVSDTCTVGELAGMNTEEARVQCAQAIVGGGVAQVFVPAGPGHIPYDAEVTAFNAARQASRPAIILFSYVPDLTYAQPLLGVFRPSRAGRDFGVALDVTIPLLPLSAALVRFDVTTGNPVPGATPPRPGRRGYIKSNCSDPDRTLTVKARFSFENGTALTARSTQRCIPLGGR